MSVALAPHFTQRNYTWTAWKAVYAVKGSLFQYDEDDASYLIWTYDGPDVHICQLWKGDIPYTLAATYSQGQNDTDKADFETNYKSIGNQPLYQSDTDGAQIVRNKAAKKGWTYAALPFEFQTARLSDTLFSQDLAGTNRTWITLKAYDVNGTEVTTAGLLNANYANIVKTVISFEPPFDYEVIGGVIRTTSTLNADMRMYIIGAPDIPAQYGGSKEMAGGINLNYLAANNEYAVDGRVTKYIKYDASTHQGKIQIALKYPAGTNGSFSIVVELYRQ